MPRGRAVMSSSAASPIAARRAAFAARNAGLMNKAELCDVPVAVVCKGADGEGEVDCWPSNEGARAVAERFLKLPKEEQTRHTEDHAGYIADLLEAQSSKLSEVREGGMAGALGPWDRALDDMPGEALLDLLFSIDSSLAATGSKIRELQPQPDESVAENSVTGEDASDDEDAEWMNQLVEDLKMKPKQANGNAAAPSIEYINVGGYVTERDAYDFIRYELGMPPPSFEPESLDYGELLRL